MVTVAGRCEMACSSKTSIMETLSLSVAVQCTTLDGGLACDDVVLGHKPQHRLALRGHIQ